MKIDERKISSGKVRRPDNPKLQEAAESLAIAALGFLAGDEERLERFVALSGIDPGNLRAAANQPSFLVAILDHLAGDEPLLLAFAADLPCDPAQILKARHVLDPFEPEMP